MLANFHPQVNPSGKTRVMFFGTSEFGVPALRKLAADSRYEIAAVVTQPDKPAGRRQLPFPSPVKVEAEKLELRIVQPPHLTSPTRREEFSFLFPPLDGEGKGGVDLFIVASYGQIISEEILQIPKFGALNIHPSLLPKYRGPSPIQAAILNGDTETGVTIIKLDEEVDHGPIIESRKWKMENRMGYQKLHDKLAEIGAGLLLEVLPKYLAGEIKPRAQDHTKATYTKIITKADGRVNWQNSAEQIDWQVRAYETWPVAWTTLDGKRLKIFSTEIHNPPQPSLTLREGGLVVSLRKLFVKCGRDMLELKVLQLEGAKKITAREFANGCRDLETKILG